MAKLSPDKAPNNIFETQEIVLPKARFWETIDMFQWEGFWLEGSLIKPAMKFRTSFQARDNDVVLASSMKTGTTWLKSLCLCIMQNQSNNENIETEDVLVKENPHFYIPTIEAMIYATKANPTLYDTTHPRLCHTHLPYIVLPDSIKNSGCKIVYIARNPKDTLVSMWHFFNARFVHDQEPYSLEKAVDCFCIGLHQYGPYFNHVLQYWLESQRRPEKILFLKYEEIKNGPKGQVRKLAEFLGKPFANEEEIDKVLWRCSLERLKILEVNKNGETMFNVPNSSYFRKGVVGDWKNYLTPEMAKKVDEASRLKLEKYGLFL